MYTQCTWLRTLLHMSWHFVHCTENIFWSTWTSKRGKNPGMVFSRRGCCCTAVVVGMKHFRYVGPRPGMLPEIITHRGRVSSLLIGQLIAFLISDWLIVSTDKNPNNTVTNQSTAQRFFQDSRLENSFRRFIQRFIHFHLSVKVTGRVSRVLRIGRERLKLFL